MGIFSRLRKLEKDYANLGDLLNRAYGSINAMAIDLSDAKIDMSKEISELREELVKIKNPSKYNVGDTIKEGAIFEVTFHAKTLPLPMRMEFGHIIYPLEKQYHYEYKCVSKGSSEIKTVTEEIKNPK